ncbi:MAG: hypothetical protein JJE10_05260 [Thermoleophilia bacterium]|nr:hypothetical protein [Thermoleophilia bacterium]
MSDLYLALGLTVIALNLIAGTVGALAWANHRVSIAFWYLLRAGQVATLVFVLLEFVIYVGGDRADDSLHYLYILLPVVASLMGEAMRGASASQELGETDFSSLAPDRQREIGLAIYRRETGVMTTTALVIAFLVWRAIETTTGMF